MKIMYALTTLFILNIREGEKSMRKSLLAVACIVGICTSAMAAAKTVTLDIVGGNGTVTVNGKPYVPGTPIKSGAKIQVQGSLTIKVGGVTIKTDGATLVLSGSSVKVTAGTAQVTNAQGATQTVAKGDKVAVQTQEAAPPAAQQQATAADTTISLPPPPPPPTPAQNTQAGVSGSGPR